MLTDEEKKTAKRAAGKAAANLVQDDMLVGLGTGSTAEFFIQFLKERVKQGLKIKATSTSKKSLELADGIPIIDINQLSFLDFTADGADEIDGKNRIIKGGGGALLREKVIATMSREWVVMIDPSKKVKQLGASFLPVEIIPFGYLATKAHIEQLGFVGKFRQNDPSLYVTDNGNYIFDIYFKELPAHPEKTNMDLLSIPGVLETGFFFNLVKKVIEGQADGSVKIYP